LQLEVDSLATSRSRHYNGKMTTEIAPSAGLEIKLFGGLEIRRDGEVVALPQSKKTRALLAYLILKGAPQRRDALCEILWEVPDDPRAALRWSLSKLRPLVNEETIERLTADRERVAFERHGASVDVARAEEACAVGLERLSHDQLLELSDACSGLLLAGLDLPSQPSYESWRLGQQDRARQVQMRVIDELLLRDECDEAARTALLRKRLEFQPEDQAAHLRLISHLASIGRRHDAEAQAEISKRMLADLGGFDETRLRSALEGNSKPARRPVATTKPVPLPEPTNLRQDIRFCTACDGARIAYATVGSGPPLVKTANWMNHLEFDWESPIWKHVFHAFAQDHTFIRYDSRGNGLSDWNVEDLTLEAFMCDLLAVVDAAGVERFPLFALSQGCAVAIEFAVRYPERVSKLILYGGYPRGWRVQSDPSFAAQTEALITLTRTGWGQDNPAYRQVFTSLFIPGATPEQMGWFNELQRVTTSPENAARLLSALGEIDVMDRLSQVTQPTLVLHARNDARVPYANGRLLAMGIPGAKFVTLESQNHLLLENEPAWGRFLAEVRAFLAD
jgi:pimeloyl-ACP methyl ester carboxylesterase/DNA-binding SARP family transcriptional activator